jgi:hypothetical protein
MGGRATGVPGRIRPARDGVQKAEVRIAGPALHCVRTAHSRPALRPVTAAPRSGHRRAATAGGHTPQLDARRSTPRSEASWGPRGPREILRFAQDDRDEAALRPPSTLASLAPACPPRLCGVSTVPHVRVQRSAPYPPRLCGVSAASHVRHAFTERAQHPMSVILSGATVGSAVEGSRRPVAGRRQADGRAHQRAGAALRAHSAQQTGAAACHGRTTQRALARRHRWWPCRLPYRRARR